MKKIRILPLFWLIAFSVIWCETSIAHNKIKCNFYQREIEQRDKSDKSIVSLCDTIVNYARMDGNLEMACRYLLRKAQCLNANGSLQKAVQTYNEVIHQVDNLASPSDSLQHFRNEAYMYSIKLLQSVELSDLSTERCYRLLKNQHNPAYLLFAHSFLAIRYAEVKDTVGVERHIRVADSLVAVMPQVDPELLSDYYNHKAGVLFFESKSDSALTYLERGMNQLKDVHTTSYHNILVNLATVYWKLGEYDLAKRCYRKGISFFKDSNPVLHLRMMYYYAGLCYEHQEVDSAFYYCQKLIGMSEKIPADSEVYGDSRILYSNLLYHQGRYKESRDYYVLGKRSLDSLNDVKKQELKGILHDDIVSIRKEQHSSTLLHCLAAYRKAVIVAVVCGLLVLLLMWLWWRERGARKMEALRCIQQIGQKERELAELQEQCQSHLVFKEMQSKILAKALMVYHDTYIQVETKLDALKHVSGPIRAKEMLADFQRFMKDNKEKDILYSFDEYFKSQFVDFIANLQQQNVGLSNNELQLCMLLVVELSAKDIAFYMDKSVRTIETMVYKLRKKFQIPADVKTSDYFKQFVYAKAASGVE